MTGCGGEGDDLLAQVDRGAHAVDEGHQQVQAGEVLGLELAQPLDDDRVGLRHDPHGPEHRHDDEQDDETDDDEEYRLDIGHGAASP